MIKNNYSGKFIVIEGLDGAGGETQTNLFVNYFKKQHIPIEKLSYPNYDSGIGKLIHDFLHRKYDFSASVQFLLYSADFLQDKEKIERWLSEGKFIISDRYFTSTIAYQCLKGFPLELALKLANLLELPKPDMTIYLKISPETSIQRKFKEKGNLDRHEADKKFLAKISNSYKKLIKDQVFSPWFVVDGTKSKEEVFADIKSILKLK